MMQNPGLLRQLTSPETRQQMITLQESLFSQLNQQPTNQESTRPGLSNYNQLEALINSFSGIGIGGFSVPNQPDVRPEDLYATQLSQLREMGFFDTQENIRALGATAGNVHAAVERLLGNPGQ